MKIKLITLLLLFFVVLSDISLAKEKTIALTIDDLPFVGEYRNFHLNKMMNAMQEQQVSATGFVIASEIRANNWETLRQFRDAGFGLGNHTFSHANLNKLKVKEYIQEIKKADVLLSPLMSTPKYFRYPYLAMSSGSKKNKILHYLTKNHYQVAPITIDTKDFVFNQRLLSVPEIGRRAYLEELKPFYLEFIWQQTQKAEEVTHYRHRPDQTQILLIHANLLNATVLTDIIQLYKQRGYTFVSLEQALETFKLPSACTKPIPLAKPDSLGDMAKMNFSGEDFVEWD